MANSDDISFYTIDQLLEVKRVVINNPKVFPLYKEQFEKNGNNAYITVLNHVHVKIQRSTSQSNDHKIATYVKKDKDAFIPSILKKNVGLYDENSLDSKEDQVRNVLNRLTSANLMKNYLFIKKIGLPPKNLIALIFQMVEQPADNPEKNDCIVQYAKLCKILSNKESSFKQILIEESTALLDKYIVIQNNQVEYLQSIIVWIAYLLVNQLINTSIVFDRMQRIIFKQSTVRTVQIFTTFLSCCGEMLDYPNGKENPIKPIYECNFMYRFIDTHYKECKGIDRFKVSDLICTRNNYWKSPPPNEEISSYQNHHANQKAPSKPAQAPPSPTSSHTKTIQAPLPVPIKDDIKKEKKEEHVVDQNLISTISDLYESFWKNEKEFNLPKSDWKNIIDALMVLYFRQKNEDIIMFASFMVDIFKNSFNDKINVCVETCYERIKTRVIEDDDLTYWDRYFYLITSCLSFDQVLDKYMELNDYIADRNKGKKISTMYNPSNFIHACGEISYDNGSYLFPTFEEAINLYHKFPLEKDFAQKWNKENEYINFIKEIIFNTDFESIDPNDIIKNRSTNTLITWSFIRSIVEKINENYEYREIFSQYANLFSALPPDSNNSISNALRYAMKIKEFPQEKVDEIVKTVINDYLGK